VYPQIGDQAWVTSYGIALVTALATCWFYARKRAVARGDDVSHVDLAVPLIFILSTLGGRVLALLSPGDLEFGGGHDLHARFRLYGLLLFALPLLFAYSRLAGISFRRMLDLLALPAVLWLVVLRAGCFLAGCCWGEVTDWSVGVRFPVGSYAWAQQVAAGLITPDARSSLPVHPSQIYELVLVACWFAVLTRIEKRPVVPGTTAAVTLAGYTVLRFAIEFVRADSQIVVGGLSGTQLLSILLLLAAAATINKLRRIPPECSR